MSATKNAALDACARAAEPREDSTPDERWIQTATGRRFSLTNPRADDVELLDIVTALSNLCRFNGHVRFYSVAQHSVLVSELVPPAYAFAALLHDAAEAYLGDLTRDLKLALRDGGRRSIYDELTTQVEAAIAERFGILPERFHAEPVREADNRALSTEKRDLLSGTHVWAVQAYTPDPRTILPLPPAEAEALFLRRFFEVRP